MISCFRVDYIRVVLWDQEVVLRHEYYTSYNGFICLSADVYVYSRHNKSYLIFDAPYFMRCPRPF